MVMGVLSSALDLAKAAVSHDEQGMLPEKVLPYYKKVHSTVEYTGNITTLPRALLFVTRNGHTTPSTETSSCAASSCAGEDVTALKSYTISVCPLQPWIGTSATHNA